MTTSAALAITKVAPSVEIFWLEDIFVTGICREKAGVTLVNDYRFNMMISKSTGAWFQNRISGHHITNQGMRKIHAELKAGEM